VTRYAEKTEVGADRSRAEIERILQRYGAESFAYGWEGRRAMIGFRMNDRMLRFVVPLPDRDDPEFLHTPTGRQRTESSRREAYEQACRQRWRALALVIKAKLEAVECGITSFEEEFLAQIMLPDGQTVGQFMLPQVEQVYLTGEMPPLLALPERVGKP
jgi:hypothetical protein